MLELSVIIPTRNRAELLEETLKSIAAQSLAKEFFEVIVIDNGSTDQTREVCERFRSVFPEFQYLYEVSPGLHVGRNKGYQVSRSPLLVYADDDIQAFPTWLEAIRKAFQNPDIAMVGGNDLPLFVGTQPAWLARLWKQEAPDVRVLWELSLVDLGTQPREIKAGYIIGCNFSVRKEIVTAARGFMPDGMPPDLLQYRGDGEGAVSSYVACHHLKAWFSPEASVYHTVQCSRMTCRYVGFIRYRTGISNAYLTLRKRGYVKFSNLLKLHLIKLRRLFSWPGSFLQYYCNLKDIDGHIFLYKKALFDKTVLPWIMQDDYLDEHGIIPVCDQKG